MCRCGKLFLGAGALAGLALLGWWLTAARAADKAPDDSSYFWQLPSEEWKTPFAEERPVLFVSRGRSPAEWDKLASFWNEVVVKELDPRTAEEVERKAVKIKMPLGLTVTPAVPAENPMTVAKWKL